MPKPNSKTKLDNDCPLLYLYVYKQMVDKFGKANQILSTKQILEVWRRCIHNIPRRYDFFILKEMEAYGLLERFTNQKNCFYGSYGNEILTKLRGYDQYCKLFEKILKENKELKEIFERQKWKFYGAKSNIKLKKLNEYFLW
jgi:hypothetical protein